MEKESGQLFSIAKFSEDLTAIDNSGKLSDLIIEGICQILGCDQASLMMFDVKNRKLSSMKIKGYQPVGVREPRIELTGDFSKWIYEGGEVFALTTDGNTKYLIIFDQEESKYFNCELRIPLFVKNNLITLLNIGKKSTDTDYSQEDIAILQILVNLCRLALENVLMREMNLAEKNGLVRKNAGTKPIQIKRRVEEVKIIGESRAIQEINQLIDQIASKDVSVFIIGESGTGKDLVARSIHQKSYRHDKPFVAMNCAALPENLVESELFGHEKGAFTGAHAQKKGKFEYADGGTLFLDEIGDMSLATQAKLLRVLEDGTFQRTGGNETLKADVRIIAATNKNIHQEIESGNFREDLYYRINVVQIVIPPLRERREDIPILAEFFFEKFNLFYHKGIKKIDDNAMARLIEYDFPGNIRELQNIIERAVIMEQGDKLSIDFIPKNNHRYQQRDNLASDGSLMNLEKEHIKRVLNQVNFNKSQAARILGIARKTLREKIQKYNLERDAE